MKILSKLLVLSSLGICLPFLSGCTKNSDNIKKADRFSIVYYPGGYGTEYLDTLCKEFLAFKKGTTPDQIVAGEDYLLQPDEDITYGADYWVTSDDRCPDLIISNLLSPKAVTQGYIASLDDVFDAKVEVGGSSVTIRDFAMPEAVEQYSFEARRGQTSKHSYAMPWTAIPLSIAYNNTILKQIPHTSSLPVGEDALENNKWARAPETVDELKAIFEDCKAYDSNLAIFGWAAVNGTNWFESLITTWWAQRQGVDNPNLYTNEGSYYDFWKYDSPDIFKQTGLQDALGTIKELLIGSSGFINSYPSVGSMTIKQSQQAFAEGKALFCLTGDFFEKEYKSFIEQSNQDFRMMRVPAIDGAETNELGGTKQLTYLNVSNCAYVPNKAANKQLAKDFLVYTSSQKMCEKMSEMMGAIRPFSYDARKTDGYSSLSNFTKSVFDLYYNADDYLVKFPRNEKVEDISPIYLYEGVSENIFCGATYFTVLSILKTLSPQQIMVSGGPSFESVYSRAERAFEEWDRIYDL